MGALIDDLLSFSRMGRAELQQGAVDLQRIVSELRREIEAETSTRSIEWRVESLPEVQGDPAMLKQVMANLILNAVKYTQSRPAAILEIGSNESDAETIVFVRDNGVGFDPAYTHKLFGVFQRLHSAEEFEGTGIGLANVRRIVQRHGGRTWAEGEVDRGATFYFSLPRRAATTHESPWKEVA
jgi:light-regulated signal transduction histidine kinase (bacteriophytochrome)